MALVFSAVSIVRYRHSETRETNLQSANVVKRIKGAKTNSSQSMSCLPLHDYASDGLGVLYQARSP